MKESEVRGHVADMIVIDDPAGVYYKDGPRAHLDLTGGNPITPIVACADVQEAIDGQAEITEAVRDHLASCGQCQQTLHTVMQEIMLVDRHRRDAPTTQGVITALAAERTTRPIPAQATTRCQKCNAIVPPAASRCGMCGSTRFR